MKHFLKLLFCIVILSSCDKGYQIRFNNLYVENFDSVVVGKNKIIFTDIERGTATEYRSIARGHYEAKCVSRSKKRFSISFFISGKGEGTKSIQIDATGQTQLIEN